MNEHTLSDDRGNYVLNGTPVLCENVLSYVSLNLKQFTLSSPFGRDEPGNS